MEKIIVAKSAGFCFGVKRSVEMAEELLQEGRAFCLGQLIHNDDVVGELKKRGLTVIGSPDELPDGERVMIRAHGVSKRIYEELEAKNAVITDATCPKVRKIHDIVSEASRNGRFVIAVGMKGHPEVEAICGWCDDHALCENRGDIEHLFDKCPEL